QESFLVLRRQDLLRGYGLGNRRLGSTLRYGCTIDKPLQKRSDRAAGIDFHPVPLSFLFEITGPLELFPYPEPAVFAPPFVGLRGSLTDGFRKRRPAACTPGHAMS